MLNPLVVGHGTYLIMMCTAPLNLIKFGPNIILRTSVATTQPKGHRQPGRSSEENDQNDQWNIEGEATFTGNETTEK